MEEMVRGYKQLMYDKMLAESQVRLLRTALVAAGVPEKTVDAILRGETGPGDPRQLKIPGV